MTICIVFHFYSGSREFGGFERVDAFPYMGVFSRADLKKLRITKCNLYRKVSVTASGHNKFYNFSHDPTNNPYVVR